MSEKFCVSVIVPFYNDESNIKTCLDVLANQDFIKPFEIIMVDDASTDNSRNIVKMHNFPSLRLYSLPSNSGPSAARNVGINKAKGEYVFFLDTDDTIAANTLTTLYSIAYQTTCDFVFSDFKRIENSQNQRTNTFNYPEDQTFENYNLMEAMRRELHDPLLGNLGLFGCNGRLIRRSIISDNNIFFEEKLRFMEDKTFCWDILSFVRSASYVRKQLYSYNVRPNVHTAVTEGLNRGFPLSNFKLIKNHIQNSLKQRGFSAQEIEKLGDQGFIFCIITILVSYSRSMILGKVDLESGIKHRRKIINDILDDPDVAKAIRSYSPSEKESAWIPRAIAWRFHKLLEFACNRRAKEVLRIRRAGEA